MKQPLRAAALVYLAGVLAADFLSLPVFLLFALALAAALHTLVFSAFRPILIWPLIFLAGWTNLAWRLAVLSPHDLRRIVADRIDLVTVRGKLRETPAQRIFERDGQESWRSLARVQVTALRRKTDWQPAFGEVIVTTPGVLPHDFFAGQTVEVYGVLRTPKGPVAPGLFDYRAYLGWQGIYYELQARSASDWRILAGPKPMAMRLADRFEAWAKETLGLGLPAVDEELRLLWAMTLGWQTALTNEVSEPFMRSGTMHIFAISGLHIALIAGILVQLLRVVQFPRAGCGLLVVPAIWFYTAATGWQPSAIRSTIMMSIIIAGWALRRPGDLLNSLAAAGLIILIWDPRQLFQAGFQLSFFVVLSIALLLPPFESIRQRLLRTDPLLPAELRPRWRRWVDGPVRFVTTSLATSLAAWLGSLPLIAYYFHLVTPISLLANLIIVPLSSLALMCNLGSLLCGEWLPVLTEVFNHSAWFWMHCMIVLSEWFVRVPSAFLYVRSPSPALFFAYYLTLLAVLTGWLVTPRRRFAAVLLLAGCISIWLALGWRERTTTHLTILPLNGGEAVFVRAAGGAKELLVDCGSRASAELVVKPFLRAQGINCLARLLLTHGDLKHIGGADFVEQEFLVDETLTSSVRFRSSTYRRLIERLALAGERWRQVNRNDRIDFWTVLHPERLDHLPTADDNSLVLRGQIDGVAVLLLSDLGQRGQTAMMERNQELRADIVVAGLPDQGEPLHDSLLDVVQPRVIIICDAEFPARERASKELRSRLARRGAPVLYTSESGAVTLRLRKRGWELRTVNGIQLSRRAPE